MTMNITLGREQADHHQYGGPADGAVSALIEIGLRAAENGDDSHALAQVFALPESARAEYRGMLAEVRRKRDLADPFGNATLRRLGLASP